MDDQKKPKDVAYGQLADQFRDVINRDSVDHLTRPATPEEKHREESQKDAPSILSDPQGTIIRARIQRFKPAITHYAKNLCMRHISQDDFLIAVRNESRKLLENIQSMGRLRLGSDHIRDKVREIVDTLYKMMDGIPKAQMDIQMVTPIVEKIMEILETAIATRAAMPDHEKYKEIREKASQRYPVPENDPLADFPPDIRSIIVERLTMIGLNPRDLDTIKRLARQFGIEDPDEAIEQLKKGEIPEKLKNFF